MWCELTKGAPRINGGSRCLQAPEYRNLTKGFSLIEMVTTICELFLKHALNLSPCFQHRSLGNFIDYRLDHLPKASSTL